MISSHYIYLIFKSYCAPIFVHLSYFPTSTSVLNCLVSHILEKLYINLRKIGFNIFLFKFMPMFYTLVFMPLVMYWSKVVVALEF